MSDLRFDWSRAARTGVAEAVFAEGKSHEQILSVLRQATEQQHPVLVTRLTADQFEALHPHCGGRLDYDPVSRTAIFGDPVPLPGAGSVGVVCAGTSPAMPVCPTPTGSPASPYSTQTCPPTPPPQT